MQDEFTADALLTGIDYLSHVRELDRLMRSHGQEILGGDDDKPLTADSVKAAIETMQPKLSNSRAASRRPGAR